MKLNSLRKQHLHTAAEFGSAIAEMPRSAALFTLLPIRPSNRSAGKVRSQIQKDVAELQESQSADRPWQVGNRGCAPLRAPP